MDGADAAGAQVTEIESRVLSIVGAAPIDRSSLVDAMPEADEGAIGQAIDHLVRSGRLVPVHLLTHPAQVRYRVP